MSIFDLFLIIGLTFILLELFIGVETGFDLVVIGFTMILSALVGRWFASTEAMISLTALLSITYILLGRSYVQRKIRVHPHATNVDTLIGHDGIVIKAIKPHQPGIVSLDGEEWRAKSSQSLTVGTTIIVTEIQGVTLIVKKENP